MSPRDRVVLRDVIDELAHAFQVAIGLATRLRRASQQVEDIVFLGLEPRLAKALLYLFEHSLSKPEQKLKLTKRDISQLIGVSRESANKQLCSWQRRKWLKLERGGLTILVPDALRRLITDSAV